MMTSPFLLLTECAEHARVPLSTVRHWIATGKLPSVRPGRRRMVRRADLDAFLAGAAAPAAGTPHSSSSTTDRALGDR
jgi:excisionase family DNA binding protein